MDIQQYLLPFEEWYKSLKIVKSNKGPANGTIATTLVLLQRLKEHYNLDFDSHIANGGAQIKGASGIAVASILKSFGETRPFAREGGRTNRGGQGDIRPLFTILGKLLLEKLDESNRNTVLSEYQRYLVDRIRDYHNRQKLKITFNPTQPTRQIIHDLLIIASNEGKGGPVAQHLVGAKLQLRFPYIEISNESTNTADQPTKRSGDFAVGDAVFHVTVHPMQSVFEKCRANLTEGLKVFLIVPDDKLIGTRQLAADSAIDMVAIESIESFVSQNIEEISSFNSGNLKRNIINLIKLYNERVDEAETDKSLMIELPSNLKESNG
ncbi:MAG: DUF4928 family protein [Saprospiraceae bacterium]|nr:DUF4928 family protein [Saprospiraceae bacterium]